MSTVSSLQKGKSRLAPQVWAALLFGIASIGPICSWFILLFHATPQSQSTFEAAASQLRFVFSAESPALWWFVGWAALPFVLAGLALCSLGSMAHRKPTALAVLLVSLVVTAVSLVFYWPVVAALTAGGSINAFRCYRSAT